MRTTMKARQGKVGAGTHRDVSQCSPSRCLALLDQVSSEMPGPPALNGVNR